MKHYIFILFLFLFFVSSCKILNKNIQRAQKKITQEQLIDSLSINTLKYKTLYLKFNANIFNNEKKLSFSGTLKINKDTCILVSIAPMGFEVGRALLSTDSITILNKFQNQFFKDDYDYILLKHNIFINYNILESILTNQLFYYTEELKNFKNVDFITSDTLFTLNQLYTNELITYNQKTFINKNLFKVTKVIINQINTENNLTIEYKDFIELENTFFPNVIDILIENNSLEYNIKLNITKIIVNKELKFKIEIPQNYERVWY